MQHLSEPRHPYTQVKESVPLSSNMPIATDTTFPKPNNQQAPLGPDSTLTECSFCYSTIRTAVRYTNTSRTLIAASRCFFICFCCCLPYCLNSAKNTDHYCPQCHKYLGTYAK